MTAKRSVCEVDGCVRPGTGSYLHGQVGASIEFRICAGH